MEEDARSFLEKARESLASAETDLIAGRYNSCANRCYYACFQAAVAALIKAGVRPGRTWGHDFVGGRFAGDLVNRRHQYPSSFKNVLPELSSSTGRRADYESSTISSDSRRTSHYDALTTS